MVISDARAGPLAPESLIRAGPRKAFEGGPARLCLEPHGSVANSRPTRLIHYRVCARLGKGGLKHAQLLAGHANISTTGDMAEVLRLLAADRSFQTMTRTRSQTQRKATTGVEPVYAALQAAA